VAGRVPFQATSEHELREKVKHGVYEFPKGVEVSEACLHMIKGLIVLDPKRRMDFREFRELAFARCEPEDYQEYKNKLLKAKLEK